MGQKNPVRQRDNGIVDRPAEKLALLPRRAQPRSLQPALKSTRLRPGEEFIPMTQQNPASFHDDSDPPTTEALRRRLESAGHLPSAAHPSAHYYKCLLCGCNIGNDPHADRALGACGTCKSRPEARNLKATPNPAGTRGFTEAEKSLIRKTHGYIPIQQLLGILNERVKNDLGPNAKPYTAEQLHAEIAKVAGPTASNGNNWAALRKLLAQARKTGTLDRITEQAIADFAVVFLLTPNQVIRLKDILLSREEDES
jgi:hypothetical protein